MTHPLSDVAHIVRQHDRDRFLGALFLPLEAREPLFAYYAFDHEIRRIPDIVSEEIIAHVRYAWWKESIEAIMIGHKPREHPVLQALAPVLISQSLSDTALFSLLEYYRGHYPDMPADITARADEEAVELVRALSPDAEKGWHRARKTIQHHRDNYGYKRNSWLHLKLLWLGISRK